MFMHGMVRVGLFMRAAANVHHGIMQLLLEHGAEDHRR
jgi:hypothetical protein